MKRIIRTRIIQKSYIITDEGEELLIEATGETKTANEYLTLTGSEKKDSLAGWRDLDKILRAKLALEKKPDQKSEVKTN